jgi:hypothetical protein
MNEFDFDVVEETAEEIIAWEPESPREKSLWHHDLISVSGRDFFTLGQPPLEDNARREKVVSHQLADLILVDRRRLKHLGARCSHGCKEESFWEKWERVERAVRARVVNMLLEEGTPLKVLDAMNPNRFFKTCHDLRARLFKF